MYSPLLFKTSNENIDISVAKIFPRVIINKVFNIKLSMTAEINETIIVFIRLHVLN